jgi:hypothetical protein
MLKNNYNLVKEVIESLESTSILNTFLSTFKVGKNIKKKDYIEFLWKYIDDGSEMYYVELNWKYIKSGGDESVFEVVD